MTTFLCDYFGIDEAVFEDYGALNISVVNDLPLFIDPFLLFHSEKPEYVALHEHIIEYLMFLRDRAVEGRVNEGQLRNWYCFPEVKQNWLGFSETGNDGAGLGIDFARSLHANLHVIFSDFGAEKITESSHLEKVCLVSDGVGRDNISDFTTNLIKDFLCQYTEKFAAEHLPARAVREIWVERAKFNYKTQSWSRGRYKLPWVNGDYAILTPKDMLTRDENWINRADLISGFEEIPEAIPDAQLRASVFNYFELELRRRTEAEARGPKKGRRRRQRKEREPTKKERSAAVVATMQNFPQIIDYYIRLKEMRGDEAKDVSEERVLAIEYLFIEQLQMLQSVLSAETDFYKSRSKIIRCFGRGFAASCARTPNAGMRARCGSGTPNPCSVGDSDSAIQSCARRASASAAPRTSRCHCAARSPRSRDGRHVSEPAGISVLDIRCRHRASAGRDTSRTGWPSAARRHRGPGHRRHAR